MTPLTVIGVAVAGGVGAGLRWLIDAALRPRSGFPWPILLVNVTGCFALAMLMGAGGLRPEGNAIHTVIAAGLLGGYTTFSTVNVDTVELWRSSRPAMAVANVAGNLLACGVASLLGLLAGVVVPL